MKHSNSEKIDNNSNSGLLKFLYEYLPLIVFFVCYKFSKSPNPIITATIYMIITTAIALLLCYILTKTVPMVALVSGSILAIFGGLTILFEDDYFIKIKPTIINLIFSIILFYAYFFRKTFLSYVFGEKLQMSKNAWYIFSLRWAIFFLFLALLNEVIWRSFSTEFWVQFKVFGMTPISLIFTISQMPFIIRETKSFQQNK